MSSVAAGVVEVWKTEDANAKIAPGGKRKGPPCGIAPPEPKRVDFGLDLHAAVRNDQWLMWQLENVSVPQGPDDPDALRAKIRALTVRLLSDRITMFGPGASRRFTVTLEVDSHTTPSDWLSIIIGILSTCRAYRELNTHLVHELSLLIRLAVALGCDLNLPLWRFAAAYPFEMSALMAEDSAVLKHAKETGAVLSPVASPLGALLLEDANVLAAALIATTHRLRFNWRAYLTQFSSHTSAVADVAFNTALLTPRAHNAPDFRGVLCARISREAGESAVFFGASHTDDERARLRLPVVRGAFATPCGARKGQWMKSRFAAFSDHNYSGFRYPTHLIGQTRWATAMNRKRDRYRVLVDVALMTAVPVKPLCAIVAAYAMDAVRPIPVLPSE